MMKANKDMNQQEFDYSLSLKRMMNDVMLVEEDLRQAKTVGIKGVSDGALRIIEGRIYDLKAAIYNGLKTVGT